MRQIAKTRARRVGGTIPPRRRLLLAQGPRSPLMAPQHFYTRLIQPLASTYSDPGPAKSWRFLLLGTYIYIYSEVALFDQRVHDKNRTEELAQNRCTIIFRFPICSKKTSKAWHCSSGEKFRFLRGQVLRLVLTVPQARRLKKYIMRPSTIACIRPGLAAGGGSWCPQVSASRKLPCAWGIVRSAEESRGK